jgi:glycosyltransferase involved in cell wall biosynthesis
VRILYFADIRFPLERANGIQTMETCHALARRGHHVSLVVRPDTQSPTRDPFEYYGLPPLQGFTIEFAPTSRTPMPAYIKRFEYLISAAGESLFGPPLDIVMTRDLGVASLLLRLSARLPLVYESHGYAPEVAAALPTMLSTAKPPASAKLSRLARREERVWRQAAGYVTITRGLAEWLAERFGPRAHVAVVHDGTRIPAADEASATASATRPAQVIVGYSGHLYPWKGVDILLEALARIPDIHATIVGGHDREPDLARLKAAASKLGLADRVTFTGLVAPGEVAGRLLGADILVLPNPASAISSHATSPLKLFEYMAAGKAIVASDLPAIREVLAHDVNALLVTPGDPGALAAAIRRLAGDPMLRKTLAAAARTAVAEYSWDRRAERLEALFTEVLASRR